MIERALEAQGVDHGPDANVVTGRFCRDASEFKAVKL
jgi:hypothetical protein